MRNTKMARDLEEPKWIESAINPQNMISDIGPWDSIPPQHDGTLKESRKQNAQLRYKMREQENIISNLTQYHKESVGQFEQQTAWSFRKLEEQTKTIGDLEYQKGNLVRDLEEQTRIASALEKRDAKMKEVFGNIASTMFLELEYQEELISELAPDDGEFFQPTHNTLVDLVENIEQWTADDHSDMMFDLEDEPQFEQLYAELLSRFDEQSCKLKIQAMELDKQKNMIDEQTSIISELQVQKGKLAGDLAEQNGKLAFICEYLGENGK